MIRIDDRWLKPQGVVLAFAMMVATGPSLLLVLEVVLRGITGSTVEFLTLYLVTYGLWNGLLVERARSERPFRWWQMLAALIATLAVPFVIGVLGSYARGLLPGLQSWMATLPLAPSAKEDALSMWILMTSTPWLLVQFVVFVGFGFRVVSQQAGAPTVER